MLLRAALFAMFALPALISGGQIPVVNGTIGVRGVKALPETASTPTPGKLRVVENSGVCGGVIFVSLWILNHIHVFGRNYAGCLSGFRVW